MATPHQDFTDARPERRWNGGGLRQLFDTLMWESDERPGVHCWRVLFSGAFVMVRRLEDGRHQLRIARKAKPKNPETGPAAFLRECDTFHRDFGTAAWIRVQPDPETAGICREWIEPAPATGPGEVPPCTDCGGTVELDARIAGGDLCIECQAQRKRGLVPCEECGKEWVTPEPQWGRQICTGCAFALGRRDTAEIRARAR